MKVDNFSLGSTTVLMEATVTWMGTMNLYNWRNGRPSMIIMTAH